MFELIGKRVWVYRDHKHGDDEGFEGIVEKVAREKWIYIKVDDPSGQTQGIWINTDLQREIQVLGD